MLTHIAIQEIFSKSGDLRRIKDYLKYLLSTVNIEILYAENNASEGVINSFYNMMLSSRIIADIECSKKNIADFNTQMPADILTLSLDDLFSEEMSWKDFSKELFSYSTNEANEKSMKIWSMLLKKKVLSSKEISDFQDKHFKFAIKYASDIAEEWAKYLGKKNTSVYDWIAIIHELIYISKYKITYENNYLKYTGDKRCTLTGAVKHFSNSSEFAKQVIIKRIAMRTIILYGSKSILDDMIEAENTLLEIEKIIFLNQSIDKIKEGHYYFYFRISANLTTNLDCLITLKKLYNVLKQEIDKYNCKFPDFKFAQHDGFDGLIKILAQDIGYRLVKSDDYMNSRSELYEYLCKIKESYLYDEYVKKFCELSKKSEPVTALNILCKSAAKGIINNYIGNNDFWHNTQITVFLSKTLEYNLNIAFRFIKKSNTIYFYLTEYNVNDSSCK